MSSSFQKNNIDYSQYGFEPEVVDSQESIVPTQLDYSQYGFEAEQQPKKEKIGGVKSALYGALEGVLGVPSLIVGGVNAASEAVGLGKVMGENSISKYLSQLPESEDQTSRRIRTGVAGTITGAPFGIPGIIAGLVGSQAGQTIREVYGKEGKFDTFGLGETAAIGADILAGGATGIASSLARSGSRTASQAARTPAIFQQGQSGLQRAVIKNTIQGEKNALQNIVNSFGQEQLRGFEQQAMQVSPNRYTQLVDSSSSALKRQADNMFRNTQLNIISPLAATPEQGATAIQQAANVTFQDTVINAERAAYTQAREAAQNLSGTAPRTIEQATALRDNLIRNNPTPEQNPVISFLNGLIEDLETRTAASTTPASNLLDIYGNPLTQATRIPASSVPTTRNANDLVDLVQRSNQAVNYGSELRQQSHRLIPVINTLRQEVGGVLAQNPQASRLYQQANNLHGTNAEIWGTRYMRNLRFAENPETIIGKTKLASNMRNLKQGVTDPTIQALAERLVIAQITEGGSSGSNRIAIGKLSPELSLNAQNASEQLIQVKDPLTMAGGRSSVRNGILKDAAQSVNTGKRPEKILDLMQTPKGYQIVRETLNGTPQSREVFNSFQRLFIEDIFSSILDKTGQIDFAKARNIFKNADVRQVTREIGGDNLIRRFTQLEEFSNNFARNSELYKNPESISLIQKISKGAKNTGLISGLLHALSVPLPVIGTAAVGKAGYSTSKITFNAIKDKILSNPRAVRALEAVSRADTVEKLAQQMPRLIAEIEKNSSEK